MGEGADTKEIPRWFTNLFKLSYLPVNCAQFFEKQCDTRVVVQPSLLKRRDYGFGKKSQLVGRRLLSRSELVARFVLPQEFNQLEQRVSSNKFWIGVTNTVAARGIIKPLGMTPNLADLGKIRVFNYGA